MKRGSRNKCWALLIQRGLSGERSLASQVLTGRKLPLDLEGLPSEGVDSSATPRTVEKGRGRLGVLKGLLKVRMRLDLLPQAVLTETADATVQEVAVGAVVLGAAWKRFYGLVESVPGLFEKSPEVCRG